MKRGLVFGLIFYLTSSVLWGQVAGNMNCMSCRVRSIIGGGNEFLSAGAFSIRMGQYEEGIRLTELGLTRYQPNLGDRAVAQSNLCAAHAARGQPVVAIEYCTESIRLQERNWRAYNNRAYSYYLLGLLSEASLDLDVATQINSDARQVIQLRGMINERGLRPRVIMEDHQ
jgi:tetratricopeptide (TPR) repeat protein